MNQVLRSAAAAASLALLGIAGEAAANALQLGRPAPPATLVTLDGQHISTGDLAGQVVTLTFWATCCGPCRQELPLLSAYAKQHASQGLTVLAFTLDARAPRKVGHAAAHAGVQIGLSCHRALEYDDRP